MSEDKSDDLPVCGACGHQPGIHSDGQGTWALTHKCKSIGSACSVSIKPIISEYRASVLWEDIQYHAFDYRRGKIGGRDHG